jgi:hypothetical protein
LRWLFHVSSQVLRQERARLPSAPWQRIAIALPRAQGVLGKIAASRAVLEIAGIKQISSDSLAPKRME